MKLQLVLVPALVAALLGWRTAQGRRRSLYDETPGGMSDETYSQRERRRYLVRRVSKALLYGLAGSAIGFGFSLYFRLHG
jgi:aminoglycoside phosphotransferase (APT) family kinase protein